MNNNKYSSRLLKAINDGRLGLTRTDFMQDDALTKHIRDSKVGFVNKLKRTIEEIKNSDDERVMTKKQRFQEIFKTEPDFVIEKSDSDGDIKSVASEAVITDDEIGEILESDVEYGNLINGLEQARDKLIVEDLSDLEKKPRILNRDLTNPREIKVTKSIIEDAIKGVEAKEKKLVELKEEIEDGFNKKNKKTIEETSSKSTFGRHRRPTQKLFENVTMGTKVEAEKALTKINKKLTNADKVKKEFNSLIREELPSPSPKAEETKNLLPPPPPSEETKEETKEETEPIPFTNAFELYPENFNDTVKSIADETKKEIFTRAAHISSVFSGIDNFKDQVTLLRDLTSDDKDFFNISDSDMESFFNNTYQTDNSSVNNKVGPDSPVRITWKDIVKHKPNVVFSKATDVSSEYFERPEDINHRKKFFQLAYYSKNILGPMTLLARLSNRTKAILNNPLPNGTPNYVPDDGISVDAQTSASSYFDFHNMENEYMGYIGNSQMSDLTDYDFRYDDDDEDDEYIPGADDEIEGGKKGGSKKKSKNTSQKKGGFLKGILKKITTCDCDKKGKRKDNKTRRRGGKKFTVRKNKKSGGKHTYRKKKGGKKQKRVRFTIKN